MRENRIHVTSMAPPNKKADAMRRPFDLHADLYRSAESGANLDSNDSATHCVMRVSECRFFVSPFLSP